jgi:enamine deaminase RidA (YjgF/YER057c/UK114 family)
MYVTDISKWQDAGRAHALFFKEIKPVTTMVEVSRLIDPGLLIEIEVSAIADK